MELRDELQRRVESLKGELESARKRAAKAKAEEETLANDLAAYQRTLEAESRRDGQPASVLPPNADRAPQPLFDLGDTDVGREVNKAQVMREIIVENRATGSTASSILEGLKRKGAECPPTYVYSALSRMKAGGMIHKRRGKFFPSESMLVGVATKEAASE